ncbi:17195_t:CDS:2 [Gigaspora margarita]|uniref:17195_t:CDS:1 n=1 Tax=Gigaspora margarita TaxID=4874 RepID=A0ABN7UGP4_GIGMA|nr:17195_t:CDS:2 [Gigaspora margarita]
MEPLNSSKSNPIDIEKPSRPGLTRINTGDRIKAEDQRKRNQGINLITSQLEEFFVTSPTDSLIDIPVRHFKSDEADTVLVALVDRDKEMKELFKRNKEYFEMVKHSIFSFEETDEWQEFLSILYSPRDLVPDLEWMNKISNYLEMNPQLLANFKEIVGFYDNTEDHLTPPEFNDEENEEITYSLVNDDEMSEFVNIIAIRDRPQILENILNSYPQFFINAQQALSQTYKRPGSALGGNHLTDDIPLRDFNDLSEHNNNPCPQLVAQFEEIVAYEIRNDEPF